jgi:hypothetical protein
LSKQVDPIVIVPIKIINMKKIFFSLLLVSAVSFMFSSCKKEETDTETQSAVDNSICEGEFMRVMPTVNSIAISETGVHRLGWQGAASPQSSCPVVTVTNPNQFPGCTLTIDYGTGCVDSTDGKTRKGQVVATFSKSWDSVGCVITINLNNFYVNNMHYEGTVNITRNTLYSFTTDVMNGKCTAPSWIATWACSRTITQTGGTGTAAASDDVFEISGNSNGVNRNGLAYTVNVTSNLQKKQSCAWIDKGIVELTPQGMATRTVNFGDGTCDNQATLTINGNTFTFTMN